MGQRTINARAKRDEILAAIAASDPPIEERKVGMITRFLNGETLKSIGLHYERSGERVRVTCFLTFRKLGFKL